jgi:hypothetical protein
MPSGNQKRYSRLCELNDFPDIKIIRRAEMSRITATTAVSEGAKCFSNSIDKLTKMLTAIKVRAIRDEAIEIKVLRFIYLDFIILFRLLQR